MRYFIVKNQKKDSHTKIGHNNVLFCTFAINCGLWTKKSCELFRVWICVLIYEVFFGIYTPQEVFSFICLGPVFGSTSFLSLYS